MAVHFYKYHGTGNDFILVDNTKGDFRGQSAERISKLCHRHFGIGADGLILFESSTQADFKMVYFNADGHVGSMCGNGGRCVTHLAHELGYVGNEGLFEGPDGLHQFRVGQNEISISMGNVSEIKTVKQGLFVDTGSPHLICFRDNIKDLDVATLGRKLRNEFEPGGVNVNFVCKNNDGYSMRTYERGVEGETLSCGTGATAAAIAIMETTAVNEASIALETLGGVLTVSCVREDSAYLDIWLTGPVRRVFKGEFQ